jgi:3-phosphoshikimate 1-carboxyvinyltransferase
MRSSFRINPARRVQGCLWLPGDKSIAHRFLLISSLALNKTTIENFPKGKDCLATLAALRQLGVRVIFLKEKKIPTIKVWGRGLQGFKRPQRDIFVADSGTTLRLLLGVLAGQPFPVRLTAGKSLSRRPMRRVTEPLRMMGAEINAKYKIQNTKLEEYPPITIKGGNLKGITYRMPIASAQVKSAILLAGLYAHGKTEVIESFPSRDHTERALKLAGVKISTRQKRITLRKAVKLVLPECLYVPGDISSASFFMVLAAILPQAEITIKQVSLNPSRAGVIKVLRRMGADIRCRRSPLAGRLSEPLGDIFVKGSKLRGTAITKKEIPSLIDEIPILMVAASLAKGKTIFKDVGELRVKETDRIRSMGTNLKKMGARLKLENVSGAEKMIIQGVPQLKGARLTSFGDHRTAMSLLIASLVAVGSSSLDTRDCISKSFPNFFAVLKNIVNY